MNSAADLCKLIASGNIANNEWMLVPVWQITNHEFINQQLFIAENSFNDRFPLYIRSIECIYVNNVSSSVAMILVHFRDL